MSSSPSGNDTLRILIVDDEPVAIRRLAYLCSRIGGIAIAGTARSAIEARRLIAREALDVVLLDIEMVGENGLSLAAGLTPVSEGGPAVIFVTAHGRHALTAFDLAAEAYLVKPVEEEKLRAALARAGARLRATSAAEQISELLHLVRELRSNSSFDADDGWVPSGRGRQRISAKDITWLEAEADYVRVHVGGGSYLMRTRFAALCAKLADRGFLRVHRSRAVNVAAVRSVKSVGDRVYELQLSDGSSIRTAKRLAGDIRQLWKLGWIESQSLPLEPTESASLT